jgi:GntR family transcriptional repressor for pyruvate dehydrogenase complex
VGTPSDFDGALLYLASDASSFVTGQTLQLTEGGLSDLAGARLVVEPACAEMAATSADRADIAEKLEALIGENERLLDSPSAEFTASAQEFHEGIVRMCGNATITLLAGALEAVWNIQEQEWAEQAATEGSYPETELRNEVIKAHRSIARRIAKGDSAGAGRAMRAHLEASQPFVDLRDRPVRVIGPLPRA